MWFRISSPPTELLFLDILSLTKFLAQFPSPTALPYKKYFPATCGVNFKVEVSKAFAVSNASLVVLIVVHVLDEIA